MFPDAYFPPGYFPPPYFSRAVGGDAPAITRVVVIFGSLDTEMSIAGKITTEIILIGNLDTSLETTGGISTMASITHLSCYRRERIQITHTVDGANLTGQTFIFELLPPGSDTPLVRKTATASGDSAVFTLTSTDTNQITGVYDYTISRPTDSQEAMGAEGTFTIRERRVALP